MGLDSRDYYRPSGMSGFSFFPPVLKYLLITNGVVYFIQIISQMFVYGYFSAGQPVTYGDIITKYFGLIQLSNGMVPILDNFGRIMGAIPANFYPWQLITYQFMHANLTHIFFNMFMLWMFGMEIEHIMGSKKFLIFYLACGLGAGLFQIILPPMLSEVTGPTIGASGAVFGVMIAFAMYFPDRYVFIYFLIPIKTKYLMAILVVIEFMSVGNQSVVAHLAHIGGAITGVILILINRKNEFSKKNIFSSFKKSSNNFSAGGFQKAFRKNPFKQADVEDAKFYDINDSRKEDETVSQEEIDKILDKISQSGYQKLSDREKKILFEASKKK
ncbi:MAG: rhomboid family intramembrane serine protease [Ignavibacteriales bacterium]|nr:rhomboid family intramembrane serine protease [Ignavibacteriales bacterium]